MNYAVWPGVSALARPCSAVYCGGKNISGIFNLGTGRSQTFNDVAVASLNACRALDGKSALSLEQMKAKALIEYTAFPDALKGKYQSFTEADLTNLRSIGYGNAFLTVEEGVSRYIPWLAAPHV